MAEEFDNDALQSKVEVIDYDENIDEEYDINVHKLIEEMEKRECLWDVNSPSYKNMEMRQTAWEDLEGVLCCNLADIKLMWKRLRNRLRYKIRSELNTNKELTPQFFNSWEYIKPLSFVHKIIVDGLRNKKPKTSILNVQRNTVTRKSSYKNIDYNNRTKKQKISVEGIMMENEDRLAKFQKEAETHIDADYLFLMSILPTLKKLPDINKMRLMIDIKKILVTELVKVSIYDEG